MRNHLEDRRLLEVMRVGEFQLCSGNSQHCFRRIRQEKALASPLPSFRDNYCLLLTGDPGLMTLINFNYFS